MEYDEWAQLAEQHSENQPDDFAQMLELKKQIESLINKSSHLPIIQLVAVLEYHSDRLWPTSGRWSVNEARKNELIKKLQGGAEWH